MSLEEPTGLAPLRDRYAEWLLLDRAGVRADREEAAADVRALQVVLRVERGDPPSWHAAMTLAGRAAAAICLDERARPGGPWSDAVAAYAAGHIRKVTRRARGAHWAAVADLPGLSFALDGVEVRALVPGRTSDLDPLVRRLQVGGTDAPVDDPLPVPTEAHLQVLVPTEPVTTLGKAMAQAGHAGMIFAALAERDRPAELERWQRSGLPVHVHRVGGPDWSQLRQAVDDPDRAWQADGLLAVRDAGFTEVEPGTVTVIARWAEETSSAVSDPCGRAGSR